MDDYNQRMDQLAKDMGAFVDGWSLDDVASVAACISAYAIREYFDDDESREKALQKIFAFMRTVALDGKTN
jgi:hypothetical protein